MFENIKYNDSLNTVINRSEQDVRYYFDLDSPTLFPRVNVRDSEGLWWEPETIEQDETIIL